jgi:hypothetical protein
MSTDVISPHALYMREWRKKNPKKWQQIAHKARAKWKANNRDQHRECQREHRYAVRREILDLLGGQHCVRCGFADWRALEIDHIHSDGRTDRLMVGNGVPNLWAFRNKLRDEKFLKYAWSRYQILCSNCNSLKRFENKEFPGQIASVDPKDNVRTGYKRKNQR